MFRSAIVDLGKKPLFQLLFLKNDEDQSVEMKETEKIDFTEIIRHLEQGESIFITQKGEPKLNLINRKRTRKDKARTAREESRMLAKITSQFSGRSFKQRS